MAIEYMFYGSNLPAMFGRTTDILPQESADAVAVADGAASGALGASGMYLIVATSDCRVRIKSNATNGAGGLVWHQGTREMRYLAQGTKIGVSALS